MTLKTTLAFIVLGTVSLLSGCSDTQIGSKSFEESRTFSIPGAPIQIALTLEDIAWPINLADQPEYSDGDFDFVTGVKVREIIFEIDPESNTSPNDQFEDGNLDSFEFVSSLDFALRATVDGTVTTVDIADLPMSDPQIASNATRLTMNVADQDIRDLIEAPGGAEILISISGTNPPDNVVVKATVGFRVGIGFR